jgi:hypothetical protein
MYKNHELKAMSLSQHEVFRNWNKKILNRNVNFVDRIELKFFLIFSIDLLIMLMTITRKI